jgi:hypothetical protein
MKAVFAPETSLRTYHTTLCHIQMITVRMFIRQEMSNTLPENSQDLGVQQLCTSWSAIDVWYICCVQILSATTWKYRETCLYYPYVTNDLCISWKCMTPINAHLCVFGIIGHSCCSSIQSYKLWKICRRVLIFVCIVTISLVFCCWCSTVFPKNQDLKRVHGVHIVFVCKIGLGKWRVTGSVMWIEIGVRCARLLWSLFCPMDLYHYTPIKRSCRSLHFSHIDEERNSVFQVIRLKCNSSWKQVTGYKQFWTVLIGTFGKERFSISKPQAICVWLPKCYLVLYRKQWRITRILVHGGLLNKAISWHKSIRWCARLFLHATGQVSMPFGGS